MIGFLGGFYLWVKALHIIAVIFWMAGMLMLPRYFAYHAAAEVSSPEDELWKARERRLLRIIINPAMIAAWLFGLLLVFHIGWGTGLWLHVKLALVVALSALHGFLARWRKAFARGERPYEARVFRMINELPSLAIILIVILVIVRPF